MKTPGRENASDNESEDMANTDSAVSGDMTRAADIIKGLAGKENIVSVSNCATRLRVEGKDNNLCDNGIIKNAGAINLIKIGHTSVQVVIGMDVEFLSDDINRLLKCDMPNMNSMANFGDSNEQDEDGCAFESTKKPKVSAADTDEHIVFEEIGASADGIIVPMEEIPEKCLPQVCLENVSV